MTQKGRQAMKKLLSIILMASMIVTLTPIACGGALTLGTAFADTAATVEIDDLKYSLNSADYTATVLGLSSVGATKANENNGNYALTIPATVTSGDKTYNVTAIGVCAFKAYSSSPDAYTKGNAKITSVKFEGSNLITIGKEAFYACSNIKTISIPASVTTIEEYAFIQCTGLTSITFAENSALTTIEDYAFADCSGLKSIIFAENSALTKIGTQAFRDCTSLSEISLPKTVETIDSQAFWECTAKKITFEGAIPESNLIAAVGDNWFVNCRALTEINALEISTNGYYTEDGVVFHKSGEETILIKCPQGKTGSYTVPKGTTSIGKHAFANCSCLTSITLLDSLKSIEANAFESCTELTDITLPGSLTSIGTTAFGACSSLKNVTLPNGPTTIQENAFKDCTGLTRITIPGSLPTVTDGEKLSLPNNLDRITIVYNGDDTNRAENLVSLKGGAAVYVKKQKPAPTGLTATAPDNSSQDNGKISGVTTTMEYKLEGAEDWIDCENCTDNEITGLAPGTYKVREKTDYDVYVEGLEATVIVPKKVVSYGGGSSRQYPKVAETEHGTITLSSNGRTATITPDAGYEIASVTVNDEDKGAVSALIGLRTGDKIAATFQKTKDTLDTETKAAVASLSTLKARSSKTAKGNVKVIAKLSTAEKAKLAALADLGYTVKYKFYRSTKKSAGYKAMFEKTSRTYSNTSGKTGTRYYYKAQIRVYDAGGTLVAKTALKECKYATRIR